MPLQAFMIGGHPSRLMKAMELHNKNVPKRYKEPLIPEPRDAIEREERLATVWMTFVLDAGFAMNSFWSQSMDLAEVRCNLPTSAEEYRKKVSLDFTFGVCQLTRIERVNDAQPTKRGVARSIHQVRTSWSLGPTC